MKKPDRTKLDRELERLGLSKSELMAAADLPAAAITFSVGELELPYDGPVMELPAAPPAAATARPKAETATAPSAGTVHTTIRIPADLLAAYKAMAKRLGVGYQPLMIKTLRDAEASW